MKANELRIGNWVLDSEGEEMQLEEISAFIDIGSWSFRWEWVKEFKPITLTEKWHKKLGGQLMEYGFDEEEGGITYVFDYGMIRVEWYENGGHWRVFRNGISKDYITIVKYVHEWQNIYHAILKEELELKEPV